LNGTSASGPHALRAFLDTERIGSTVEVKLLREGTMLATHLIVAAQPGETFVKVQVPRVSYPGIMIP
jgi:hypothetical protein